MMFENIWVIGTGNMAGEYSTILKSMGLKFTVVARSKVSATKFKLLHNVESICDVGVQQALSIAAKTPPKFVIVATSHDSLFDISKLLISNQIENVLIEKPAALSIEECERYKDLLHVYSANIQVAYNRRCLPSVSRLKEEIKTDPLRYAHFNFSEWIDVIESDGHSEQSLKNWFFLNCTHIIDLAFFVMGRPKILASHVSGGLPWHPAGHTFSGSGATVTGCLFSFNSVWGGPTRWELEFYSQKAKYVLSPVEILTKSNSIEKNEVLVNSNDGEFKPGLHEQVQKFLACSNICSLNEHLDNLKFYNAILKGQTITT